MKARVTDGVKSSRVETSLQSSARSVLGTSDLRRQQQQTGKMQQTERMQQTGRMQHTVKMPFSTEN